MDSWIHWDLCGGWVKTLKRGGDRGSQGETLGRWGLNEEGGIKLCLLQITEDKEG